MCVMAHAPQAQPPHTRTARPARGTNVRSYARRYLVRTSFKGKFSVSRWPSLKRMTRLTSNST